MNLVVYANFHYSGKWNKLEKAYIEKNWTRLREYYIDVANPKYSEWNEEFDKLYPDKDTSTVEDFRFYSEWISLKSTQATSQVHKNFKGLDCLFKCYFSAKYDGDIVFKNIRGGELHVDLTPVEK